jgi:cell wall-associated NlpC family hydrolase
MDSAAPDAPVLESSAELAIAVRAALTGTYARPIVVELEDGVAVLGGKPLELARGALLATHGADTAERVIALDIAELPWHAVPAEGLTLWRQHGKAGADGEVVTQLEAGDPPIQVIVEDEGWLLLRLADGAQGWIEGGRDELEPADAPRDDLADASRVDVDAFVDAVLSFTGAPYVWGGTTDDGVDCSGLVQRAAWRAGGCWLPRHSRALLKVGSRVAPSAISRGDVLVLQRDPTTYDAERLAQLEALAAQEQATGKVPAHGPAIHPMHVAVALASDEVIHASRDTMRVAREPLESLRGRYRVLGVRRLGPAKERA